MHFRKGVLDVGWVLPHVSLFSGALSDRVHAARVPLNDW